MRPTHPHVYQSNLLFNLQQSQGIWFTHFGNEVRFGDSTDTYAIKPRALLGDILYYDNSSLNELDA
eukprot:1857649-Amphidinium_carterae.1